MIKRKELRMEIIESKIGKVIDSVEFVEENIPKVFGGFRDSRIIRGSVYKEIESAIESIMDVCNIINSDLRLGAPETEDTILEHMGANKIFDEKIIELIKEMKGFRNILVHKYGEINDKRAFETIKEGLKDFELIIKEIEAFLKKQKC